MKGSGKKVPFSPPPIKSPASPKVSDENDWGNHQQKKKHAVKSFMSPTVCAASKVSFPRKKILGERNQSPGSNDTDSYLSKTPNLVSKVSPKIVSKDSNKNSPNLEPKVASKDPSSQETPLSYNSRDGTPSISPYDPLTNYLSPRPQFLRYNPNRRKEIFLRLEMEDDDDKGDTVSGETSSLDSAASSSCEDEESSDESESLLAQEDEEFDRESEEEGEEEEVTWSLRGALKYFTLSVILVLNVSYILSVNGPVSVPSFETSSPTLGFQNLSAEGFDVGYRFLDGKPERLGLLSITQVIVDEVIDEQMTENANIGYIVEDGYEKASDSEEFSEIIELQEIEETEELIEDVMEENGETQDVTEDELVDDVKQPGQQAAVDSELVRVDHQASLLSEGIDSSVEIRGDPKDTNEEIPREKRDNVEQPGQQAAVDSKLVRVDHQASLLPEGTDSSVEIREDLKEAIEEIPREIRDNDMVHPQIIRLKNAVNMVEEWGRSIALKFQELNLLKGVNQDMGTGVAIVVFGFLTCAAIVASFVFGSNIRRKGIESKQSSPADDKHSTKPVVKEKPSMLLPLPVERDEPKMLTIPNTTPLNTTTSAVPAGSRAPTVELLAEFDVGGISRSVKSCGAMNSRMSDEISSSRSNSYFSEQGFSQLSGVNSSNKKKSRKELGSNDSQKEVALTPLRRSTRIRNRADVVSP